jgi:hypothetical protein
MDPNTARRFLYFSSMGRSIEQSWQKIDFIRAKVFIASGRIASPSRLLSISGQLKGLMNQARVFEV